MYYSFPQKELPTKSRLLPKLFLFILSFFVVQTLAFALEKKDIISEYRNKGYEAQQKGDLNGALANYTKAVSLGLDTAEVYNDMGVIYEQGGSLDKAEESYLTALQKDKNYLPTYMNLGCLYERKGKVTKAAEYLQKRIEAGDPDDPWTTKAEDKLRGLAKKSPAIKEWLSIREAQRKQRQAKMSANQELTQQMMAADHHLERAKMLEKEGKNIQALEEYNKALFYTPDNPKILQSRKMVLYKMTKQQVQDHVDSAMKYLNMGDTSSAKVEFRNILTVIPDEPIHVTE